MNLLALQNYIFGEVLMQTFPPSTFRLSNRLLLTMYLHWVLQDSLAALIGFSRFDFL